MAEFLFPYYVLRNGQAVARELRIQEESWDKAVEIAHKKITEELKSDSS